MYTYISWPQLSIKPTLVYFASNCATCTRMWFG